MKLNENGQPICIGLGPSRPCGALLHPGYSCCTRCLRHYDGDEMRWAQAENDKWLRAMPITIHEDGSITNDSEPGES